MCIRDRAEALAEKIKGKEFRVYDVKAADKATPPPMLYDLTELQRDANKQYQMSAKDTPVSYTHLSRRFPWERPSSAA